MQHRQELSQEDPYWRKELQGAVRETRQLATFLNNVEAATLTNLKCQITPYLIKLMDVDDTACPIRMQYIPTEQESAAAGDIDELDESAYTVDGTCVVHKYKNTALFLVTNVCASYCRFCTRKRMVSVSDCSVPNADIVASLEYIRKSGVRDVLLSGGDPLLLSNARLDWLLSSLRAIPTVKTIRIGSRIVSQNPYRITDELASILGGYNVYLNIHINHPKEITPLLSKAVSKLVQSGVVVSNQSVMLKGINNDLDTLEALFSKLVSIQVRPYYMYSCDNVVGASHFIVPYKEFRYLARNLYDRLTGMERPTFIVDTKQGKFPLDLGLLVETDRNLCVVHPSKPTSIVGEHLW